MKIICLLIFILFSTSVIAMECREVKFTNDKVVICIDSKGRIIYDKDLWDDQTEWNWFGYSNRARRTMSTNDGRIFELGLRPDGVVVWRPYKEKGS